uniref:Death domain-containing protein n=1 Tax=Steinernema glaseri TaxID=37863 RepID=A0A1I7YK01_9BILA
MALGLKWWVGENAVHYLLQEIEAQSILTPEILRIAKRDVNKLSEDQRTMVAPVFEAMWARFPSDPRGVGGQKRHAFNLLKGVLYR